MAFLGLRGLIAQSLRDGNQQQALDYAQRAFALRPQTPWVVHSLFDMQAQTGQWKAAQETLETGMRQKVVTAEPRPHAARAAAGRAQPHRRARRQRRRRHDLRARGLRPRARAHRRREPAGRAADQGRRRQAGDEDAGAHLGAGAASRSRRALSQGGGRERSAEAGRHRAQARGAEARRHGKQPGAGAGRARCRPVGRGAPPSRCRRRQQSVGAGLPPDGRGRGARAVRPGQGARLADPRGARAGRQGMALLGLPCASRELALGVRELRRVRHPALARARHLRPGPAATKCEASWRSA